MNRGHFAATSTCSANLELEIAQIKAAQGAGGCTDVLRELASAELDGKELPSGSSRSVAKQPPFRDLHHRQIARSRQRRKKKNEAGSAVNPSILAVGLNGINIPDQNNRQGQSPQVVG